MVCSRGVRAEDSRGRAVPEEPCAIRTCFQRDVDRITHSKSFRRLKHKTQVFLQPEGDHYRTRLTHTLEVSRIARTFARALELNEDLAEAISLGHDLGHTPFGHAGERALDDILRDRGGFRHYEQSLRVVDILEKEGCGLNLTWEVRNGILRHTTDPLAATLEGQAVRLADRVAYVNHDIDEFGHRIFRMRRQVAFWRRVYVRTGCKGRNRKPGVHKPLTIGPCTVARALLDCAVASWRGIPDVYP